MDNAGIAEVNRRMAAYSRRLIAEGVHHYSMLLKRLKDKFPDVPMYRIHYAAERALHSRDHMLDKARPDLQTFLEFIVDECPEVMPMIASAVEARLAMIAETTPLSLYDALVRETLKEVLSSWQGFYEPTHTEVQNDSFIPT